MHIQRHALDTASQLLDGFQEEGLFFGDARSYASLLSPSSTVLTVSEAEAVREDLDVLWRFFKGWTTLYLASVAGQAPPWIARLADYDLSPQEITAQRLVARAGLEPRTCRVDYVTIDENRRQLAEVQWQSGGPGLFFGIHDSSQASVAVDEAHLSMGCASERFGDVIWNGDGASRETFAINTGAWMWLRGESYLRRAFRSRGLPYLPVLPKNLPRVLRVGDHGVELMTENGARRVDFIYGSSFARTMSPDVALKLAKASVDNAVWLECPMNTLYKQKWGFALAFMPGFEDWLPPEASSIIIPSVLVWGDRVDLSPLVPHLVHDSRDQLAQSLQLEQLAEVPDSLRRQLVFKCAAGTGPYFRDSKGVFRLGGSRSCARKVLDFIRGRTVDSNEPWIAQVYVNSTTAVPVCHPARARDIEEWRCHARLLIFGRRLARQRPEIICGIGNYGRHWKVTGKSASLGQAGDVLGTAFNDMRVAP